MKKGKGTRRSLLFLLIFLLLFPLFAEKEGFLRQTDAVYHSLGNCIPWLMRW